MKIISLSGVTENAEKHWEEISTPEEFEKTKAAINQIRKDGGFNADNVNTLIDTLNEGDTNDRVLYFNNNTCVILSIYLIDNGEWIWILTL